MTTNTTGGSDTDTSVDEWDVYDFHKPFRCSAKSMWRGFLGPYVVNVQQLQMLRRNRKSSEVQK